MNQSRENEQRLQDQIEQLRAGLSDMAGSKNESDEKLQGKDLFEKFWRVHLIINKINFRNRFDFRKSEKNLA